MKTKMTGKALLMLAMTIIALSACKKDKTEEDNDTSSVTENAQADAAYTDVANIADEAVNGSLESYRGGEPEKIFTNCALITVDTMATPHRITINFGTSDCLCKDGNYRRGIIYVDFTGQYRDSGSTHTISFNDYYVNYNKIDGTKVVTNKGRNASGNLWFTIVINGSIIWDAQYGGGTSTYSSNRTREWIGGENTMIRHDDVYLISGSASGTNRSGGTYSMSTISPLRKRIGFKHFTEGIMDVTPSGKPTRRIDYSYLNSAEDNLARVTINGNTYTITLR